MHDKRIYLDLDGVMYDFEGHYLSLFGHAHDSVSDADMWKNIHAHGHFFKDVPLYEGAYEFYMHIRTKYRKPIILTACPKADYANSALYKRAAVQKDLSGLLQVLPILHGKNKWLFMHKPGDVLIDDFEKNIKPWNDAGGIGIHHKNFDDTKERLKEIFT